MRKQNLRYETSASHGSGAGFDLRQLIARRQEAEGDREQQREARVLERATVSCQAPVATVGGNGGTGHSGAAAAVPDGYG